MLDALLDSLLDGGPLPGDDQAGLQPVADVLDALRAPASPAELAGETHALAEFRAQPQYSARAAHSPRSAARAGRPPRSGRVRPGRTRRGPLLRPRPAMAFAAGAAVLAGLAAGAYAGDLPGPVEKLAHTIGLTTPSPTPSASHTRPSATSSPTTDRSHHHRRAQPHASPGQHTASHDRDGHQHDGQQGSQGPTGAHSGSPSPSASATPEPSTSPAAQPSPQSSTSPSPHQHSSSSSPP